MNADERVVWWCTTEKYGGGSGVFNPGFSETKEVRVVSTDQIRQCGRMERMKNGADIESTGSEFRRASIQFNVTRKEEKCEKRRTTEAESVPASEQQEDSRLCTDTVGVLMTSHEVQL